MHNVQYCAKYWDTPHFLIGCFLYFLCSLGEFLKHLVGSHFSPVPVPDKFFATHRDMIHSSIQKTLGVKQWETGADDQMRSVFLGTLQLVNVKYYIRFMSVMELNTNNYNLIFVLWGPYQSCNFCCRCCCCHKSYRHLSWAIFFFLY